MTFHQLVRFTSDAGALEKILRLLQSLCQIISVYTLTYENAETWTFLKKQFALGRRYFRFFRFLNCFSKAWKCFHDNDMLGTGKWGCLGIYMALESVTILDAMGFWPTPWAAVCMLEANRFWFYSLALSMICGSVELFSIYSGASKAQWNETAGETHKNRSKSKEARDTEAARVRVRNAELQRLRRSLVIDFFDMYIPGNVTGWIPTNLAIVGCASVISTSLSSKEIWDRLKGET